LTFLEKWEKLFFRLFTYRLLPIFKRNSEFSLIRHSLNLYLNQYQFAFRTLMEISRDFRELTFQLVILYHNITSRQNYLVFLAKGAEPEIPNVFIPDYSGWRKTWQTLLQRAP